MKFFTHVIFAALIGVTLNVPAAETPPDFERIRREHWAYQPIRPAAIPNTELTSWQRNDVDRFILAKLEAAKLRPVADADRATLARRVYFDLIGLPPTPEQIDAFVNDKSTDAFEKLVDQLLASPHFGERWGRHWLDVVRFGESLTLRGFVLPDTWKFRDYVIEAFNSDRPFNTFMQEHVAGDLMPYESVAQHRRQLTGTTFLAIGNTNLEEQDKKQLRMDVVDEQLDTIGKAFLGQTIGCARCHDHKFDPISASDYYAMAGILRNTKVMEHANVSKWIKVPLPEEPALMEKITARQNAIAALNEKLDKLQRRIAGASTATTDKRGKRSKIVAIKDLPGIVVDDSVAKKAGTWTHSTAVDTYVGNGYLHDDGADKGEKTLTFQPDIPKTGRYDVRLSYMSGKNRATNVPVMILSEDGEKTVEVDQRTPPLIDSRFVSLGVYRFVKDGQGYVQVSNEGTNGVVVADAVQFLPADDPAEVAKSAEKDADVRRLEAELEKLEKSGPKQETIVSVVEESEITDTQIHARGSVHLLGATVPRGFLSCVPVKSPPKVPDNQSGRLQFGQWLAASDNPLPPRVMVNRVWHWLMGQGIVRTVDNFGTTGEAPSHPELLDYLSERFIADGWSVKKLVRTIVLSRAYQLSSAEDSASLAGDPENRLHWRMDRRRLDVECIRDAMMMVSGQLDLSTSPGSGYDAKLDRDYGFQNSTNRRSVYVPIFRNALPEIFEVFDFPDPSLVVGKRSTSTVSPQALFMLNHPFPKEQASTAAERLMKQPGLDDAARVSRATRLVIGREPTEGEREIFKGVALSEVFHALFASPDFRNVN